MTLGESDLSEGILANNSQLWWWVVSIRVSPLQSNELGILQISDQGGSWMKIMLNWLWVSRIVLTIREFFQTFCENTLRFCTIIVEVHHSPKNESTWSCFHGSQHISFVATPCWIYISRMDTNWNQLGDCLDSLSIWMYKDMVSLSLFQVGVG